MLHPVVETVPEVHLPLVNTETPLPGVETASGAKTLLKPGTALEAETLPETPRSRLGTALPRPMTPLSTSMTPLQDLDPLLGKKETDPGIFPAETETPTAGSEMLPDRSETASHPETPLAGTGSTIEILKAHPTRSKILPHSEPTRRPSPSPTRRQPPSSSTASPWSRPPCAPPGASSTTSTSTAAPTGKSPPTTP
jgi:hypothetical protein